ncbi:MAG: rRNA maturation RNase YbeY [Chloroflexi bacterium]|nr:rRNA maturation RNase YbeY [Chloroflexota bacterium]
MVHTDMQINVLIDKELKAPPRAAWLRSVARKVLLAGGVSADAELGLLITGQEKVRQLNRDYRGKDVPTDVLSFAMAPGAEETFIAPPDGVRRLGEVIISYPQAVIQAKQRRHSVAREIVILIIHGVLHLLGYDHEKTEERRRMRAKEREILSRIPLTEKRFSF